MTLAVLRIKKPWKRIMHLQSCNRMIHYSRKNYSCLIIMEHLPVSKKLIGGEMEHGLQNLRKHGKQVDFIFSHDGPASDVAILGRGALTIDPLNQYLEKVKQEAVYKKWFFGHHHRNMQLTDKDSVIYENIERIW